MQHRIAHLVLATAVPIAIALVNVSPLRAQPAKPVAFEVASIKPHPDGDTKFSLPQFLPGGRFTLDAPLYLVVGAAYNLPFNPSVRLTGLPNSMPAYRIDATAPADAFPAGLTTQARIDRMRLMLQTLLADRFKLAIRRETKELPIYALVVNKGGPKLQKADIEEKDCPEASANPEPGTPKTCHTIVGGQGRGLHARAADMSDVVRFVENWAGRPLVDKTGIKGLYRLDTLGWQPMQVGPSPPAGTKAEDGRDFADVPTLFTVFEQLGLKMESQKGPVDVYVIEHIEKPTEN
jgi:uncharacterized protein (TIGR03435 family)